MVFMLCFLFPDEGWCCLLTPQKKKIIIIIKSMNIAKRE
jgi:hypothetical protein